MTTSQKAEVVSARAFREGCFNGAIAFIPSYGAVWAAMKNAKFLKSTNWQSRTALVIMPPLFTFAFTAESTLGKINREMASERDHIRDTTEWAEKKHAQDVRKLAAQFSDDGKKAVEKLNTEVEIINLYRQSVENSGVRVIPGDTLGIHHRIANFWQENPLKVLGAMAAPAIAYIFYGRNNQQHLQLQMKVMQTRVLGQGTVLIMLITLMGFKQYMDTNGKFITQADANSRVEEMRIVREGLLERLNVQKAQKVMMDARIRRAQESDVAKNVDTKKKKNKKKNKEALSQKLESHAV